MKKLLENKKNLISVVVVLIILIILPLFLSGQFTRNLLILTLIWSIVGMGWNVIGGYTGQVSNGHSLYYGFGAYSVALSMSYLNLPPWIAMFLGIGVSMAFAFIVGKPLLRLKGHVFAIATMALAESARIIFINVKFTGGAAGVYLFNKNLNPWLYMQFDNSIHYYYIYLAFALVILLSIKLLDKSKFFYYLRTIKGNEVAAESIGINVAKYKIYAYMLSAAIVSVGGSLYAQYMLYIDPSMLMTLNISMMIVLVAVMGGVGTVLGPVLGAIVLTFISEYSRSFLGKYSGLDLILYGVLVIITVLYLPGGLISLLEKKKSNTNTKVTIPKKLISLINRKHGVIATEEVRHE